MWNEAAKVKSCRFIAAYTAFGSDSFGNATLSAKIAGYAHKTAGQAGNRLLKSHDIKGKIDKIMSEQAREIGIDAKYVLKGLKHWADMTSDQLAPHAIKSLELLGKHLQMFTDRHEIELVSHEDALDELE